MHIVFPIHIGLFHASGGSLDPAFYFIFNYFRSCARRSFTCAIISRVFLQLLALLRRSLPAVRLLTNFSLLKHTVGTGKLFCQRSSSLLEALDLFLDDQQALQTAYRSLPWDHCGYSIVSDSALVLLDTNIAGIAKGCKNTRLFSKISGLPASSDTTNTFAFLARRYVHGCADITDRADCILDRLNCVLVLLQSSTHPYIPARRRS